jgi:hypothetical protein
VANSQSVTDDTDPALIAIDLTDVNEVLEAFYAWLADFMLTAEPSDDSDSGGLVNLTEFMFACDPTDPAFFRLEFAPFPLE